MRNALIHTLVVSLAVLFASVAIAQDRPIDFSSQGANVFSAPGARGLSLPSQAAPAAVVATFLQAQGLLPATVSSLVVTSRGRSSRTGHTHLRFAQVVDGLTVYGTYVKAAVHDDGGLAHLIENLATPPAGGLRPSFIDERAALDAALAEVHPDDSPSLTQGARSGDSVTFTGGEFFYRLHFELELPYPWGRLLASLAAMTMLVALVTGVIAHKRIFKDVFTFRPFKGQRSWLDGHNGLGVLAHA